MLKSLEKLIKGDSTKVGNHSMRVVGGIENYTYHYTVICEVNHVRGEFKTDNGGFSTVSTTRAINDYRRYFKSLGYKDLNEEETSC